METTFENARVWDRVWSIVWGWGEIRVFEPHRDFAIFVVFARHAEWYSLSGVCINQQARTLFWDEIKFDIPPRPKRKVEKRVEADIYLGADGSVRSIHFGEDLMLGFAKRIKGTVTYETEE